MRPLIVDGVEFEFVTAIEPQRGAGGVVQAHKPQTRYKNVRSDPLNRYGAGPFCKFNIPRHFQASGVYIITKDTDVCYIGECINLSDRFNNGYGNISPKNCFKGGQETNCRLNALIYEASVAGRSVELWFRATNDRKEIEARLRARVQADWNRV